jgi:hypothetical protein
MQLGVEPVIKALFFCLLAFIYASGCITMAVINFLQAVDERKSTKNEINFRVLLILLEEVRTGYPCP